MDLLEIIDLLLLGLISAAVCYNCYSSYLAWKFLKADRARSYGKRSLWPAVSVIKPVAGADNESFENFASFCRQDYPRYEVVFAYEDPNDPAGPVIRELAEAFPHVPVRAVTAQGNNGPNYKVGNLRAAIHHARHRILVISDGDMRVEPDYLKTVVSELPTTGLGLVTCLYRSITNNRIGSVLQSLTLQSSFIPNVLFDCRLRGLSYAFGATLCTTRKALRSIGGIHSLQDYLADDYQIGYRLRRMGYPVRLSAALIDHVSNLERFRDYFFHQLRWAVTQRACRPAGYRAAILIQGVVLAALYLGAHLLSPQAWLVFAVVASIRILTVLSVESAIGSTGRNLRTTCWLVPVNDLLNGLIWLISLFTKTVYWRNRRFRVLRDGRMVEAG